MDYLSLSSHPYVKAQGIAYALRWGSGCLPTRMIPSYEEALRKSESRLAQFLSQETVTFYESEPHLLNGIPHTDNTPYFGVLGSHGFGLQTESLTVGHFSKPFGSYTSYIACNKEEKEILFERYPALHKEQYIPPLFLGMIDATIQLLPSLQSERASLYALKQKLIMKLRKSAIFPEETRLPAIILPYSVALHNHLLEHAIIAKTSKSQITLFLNMALSESEVESLFQTLSSYKEPFLVEAL